ncbi:hypothetical protein MTR_5g070610 [Medicago truncatula]|uniref:Uncharacterized protein n=1 Tax=Medicago truncatula TaxID=3880 RepID=G7KE72_MEDTR|nr:hypothetical protein MTR_5g070610 [Medicago truncatula]
MSSAMLKGVRFDNKGLRSGHRGIAALICCLMFFLEESLGDSSFVLFVCGRVARLMPLSGNDCFIFLIDKQGASMGAALSPSNAAESGEIVGSPESSCQEEFGEGFDEVSRKRSKKSAKSAKVVKD